MHTVAGSVNWNAVVVNAAIVFGMIFYAAAIVTFFVKRNQI